MTALLEHRKTPSDTLTYRSSKKDRLNGEALSITLKECIVELHDVACTGMQLT